MQPRIKSFHGDKAWKGEIGSLRTSGLDIRLVAGVVLAGACERPLVDVDMAEELALDRVLVPRAQRCVCTHTLLLYIHCPSKWAGLRKGEKETEAENPCGENRRDSGNSRG